MINMTENKEIPYKEWLKKRQDFSNDQKIRAQAFYDRDHDGTWTWLRDLFRETKLIYGNFEYLEDNQIEESKQISKIFNMMLGVDDSATEKEIEERAKILGNIVQKIIDDARQTEEEEQKLKDKVLKGSDGNAKR
jgi:hypothetical protein